MFEQAIQETDIQDECIRELGGTLREMLATANEVPDLQVIQNTTNVLEQISRQSLEVASLIHEYTKLPWAGNSIPLLLDPVESDNGLFVARIVMPGDLKSRIDECRKRCATLKDVFDSRPVMIRTLERRRFRITCVRSVRFCRAAALLDITLVDVRTKVGGKSKRPARYSRVHFLINNDDSSLN